MTIIVNYIIEKMYNPDVVREYLFPVVTVESDPRLEKGCPSV